MRDIAAAAGIGHGTVFRLIGSKDELLSSIMGTFGEKTEEGSREVLRSKSSPIEKLDALSWININALERFGDEFRIQLAWMRQTPKPRVRHRVPHSAQQTKTLLSKVSIRRHRYQRAEEVSRVASSAFSGFENIVRDIGTAHRWFKFATHCCVEWRRHRASR